MKITTIGLDIAKSVFHLLAMNPAGRVMRKKQVNTPPARAGGFVLRLKAGLISHTALGTLRRHSCRRRSCRWTPESALHIFRFH